MPGGRLFDSTFGFYLHASTLFKAASLIDHEIHFAQLALSNAPSDWNTTDLWNTVIKGATDMGYWDGAYAALMSTPHELLSVDVLLRSSAFSRLTILAGSAIVPST